VGRGFIACYVFLAGVKMRDPQGMTVQSPGPPAAKPDGVWVAPKKGSGPLAWIGYGVIMFIAQACRAAAPPTTAARSERTGSHTEGLLRLTSAKKAKLENALEKVWIAHVLVAGIGIATVFNVGKVTESLIARHLQGTYDVKTIATILLATHLYYFMRTGPLLNAFNKAKALHDMQLEGYLTVRSQELEEAKADPIHPLYGTTSFMAAALYPHADGYLIITTFVVSVAQAAALFLVVKAYAGAWISWLCISLVISIILAFDLSFWQRERRYTPVLFLCSWVAFFFFSFRDLAP
jgi:hypothetical protein